MREYERIISGEQPGAKSASGPLPLSTLTISTVALLGLVVLGWLDYSTGPEISFSIFYLIPLAWAAWRAGRNTSLWIAVVAAGIWLACEMAAGLERYSHPAIPYWNACVRLGFFLLAALSISALRRAFDKQAELLGKLRASLEQVKTLSGLLPMCSYCKKIRDDKGYWCQVEAYIANHTDARFSHGICHTCLPNVQKEFEAYAAKTSRRETEKEVPQMPPNSGDEVPGR